MLLSEYKQLSVVGRWRCVAHTCIVPTAWSDYSRILLSVSTFWTRQSGGKKKVRSATQFFTNSAQNIFKPFKWPFQHFLIQVGVGNNCSGEDVQKKARMMSRRHCEKRWDKRRVTVQSFGIKFNHSVTSVPKHCNNREKRLTHRARTQTNTHM